MAELTGIKALLADTFVEYLNAGFDGAAALAEAEREIRMTVGDPYLFRSEEELTEMRASDAAVVAAVRESAGVCDEFPMGEFAVAGYNTGGWSMFDCDD